MYMFMTSVTTVQPLEIGVIQARLKLAGLSISKDKLTDILDFMVCEFV